MLEVEMVEKLIRGGIAPRRADRLVSEFKAHYDDLRDEHLLRGESPVQAAERATAQLGYSTEFIERILLEPRLKSFASRRPWIAYVLLPVMGFAGLFVASICALLAAAWVLESFYGPLTQDPLLVRWLALSGSLYLCWISPILGTCLLAWVAFSRRAFLYWPSIGIILVALLGSHTNFGVELVANMPKPQFTGGIGLTLSPSSQTWMRFVISSMSAALVLVTLDRKSKQQHGGGD